MSIPLVQDNEKDSINTSIIAIKRNIERINMLLGLVDNSSPDLSGFATKQELQDAVTELQPVDEVTVGNMQSVTSNAVARAIQRIKSYFTTEQPTGGKWVNGKPIYRIAFDAIGIDIGAGSDVGLTSILADKNVDTLVTLRGCLVFNNFGAVVPMPNSYIFLRYDKNDKTVYIRNIYSGSGQNVTVSFIAEYTKTTD